MKTKMLPIITFVVVAALLLSGCGSTEPTPTEPTQTTPGEFTQEESQEIALEFLKNSATYKFDGIAETLTLADTLILRCPYCWTFIYKFDSRHGGYGDRTGQMVTQVLTPHGAAITVVQGKVTSAIMDGRWDMEFQMLMATEEESLEIAEEFLKNSPTFQFDGIEGSIRHIDTLEVFCPYCWGFVFEFECASAGYGDRTDLQVATVITPHEAVISVSQGTVDGGTIDGVWDMVKQQMIAEPEIKTAEHN